MNALHIVVAAVGLLVLNGCAGRQDYTPPLSGTLPPNTRVVDAPREQVWNKLIPALSRQFFVINTIDRQSGLINVSYSGNPEAYIDCGRVVSYVKNARGERNYDFPGARAQQSYEIMNDSGLLFINRSMDLEGRVNLIVEEIGPRQTRVTANTRYVATRRQQISNPQGQSANLSHSMNFNSGGTGALSGSGSNTGLTCRANGQLEAELIGLAG